MSAGWDPRSLPSQAGKTIVITGGNGGIGYFASEQLAAAGATVVMASRSKERADAAAASIRSRVPSAQLGFVPLDLSSLESVREAATKLADLGPIDVFVNNAGVTTGSNERQTTTDGLELVVGTNAFGPFALTALVYPSLRPGARVIGLGSMATRLVKADIQDLQAEKGKYNFFRSYAFSKHAMHALIFELQRRATASGSGIEALLAHPGFAVDALSPRRPGINDGGTRGQRFVETISGVMAHGKDRGAWPVVRAAIDPAARDGEFYGPRRNVSGRPVLTKPVPQSADPAFGAEFWRQAEAATGIPFTP